ncbi:2-methylthioadenine synthetase [Candidatus Pacearchaeota archaeon]|nr:2-methylthioadenine synthetase [Candidatus Pacearchaeota archaeon]
MKILIKTYGCQANINDSEILAGKLKSEGNELVNTETKADKIIVNTCSVKNKTQSKILHYLNQHQDKQIEIGGCLTNTINLQEKFPKVKTIDTINTNKLNNPIIRRDNETAIIQISQGCLNNCTFCATKSSRGNLQSYRIGDIKRQLESAVNNGATKINLTSQDNGCYGFDINTNLPELLNELTTVKGNFIIRVGMMNPWHLRKISNQLINSMKSEKIQNFLHIPVQSGSEKVLKDMKRIHTTEEFKDFAKAFRKTFPRTIFHDSTIATDIIVGYPTETEEDFQQTLSLISEVKPEVLNISAFSSRPKTPASKLKQLDSKIIKERTKKLNEVYWEYRRKI